MLAAGLGGYLARRLANDLQRMNESENQHLVVIEVFARRPSTKRPTEMRESAIWRSLTRSSASN